MNAIDSLTAQIISLFPDSLPKGSLGSTIKGILSEYNVSHRDTPKPANLPEHIMRFLTAKKVDGLSAKTLANYLLYLTKFSECVDKDIRSIDTDDIRAFLGSRNVKSSSLQTICNILRSFFAWLVLEECINKNPMLKIKVASKRNRQEVQKALAAEELERLRQACKTTREQALVEFLYSTGCRLSEVSQLMLSQVDFAQRTATVIGKGNKRRTVYFSIKAKLLLEQYIRQRKFDSAMLFSNLRNAGAVHTRTVQRLIGGIGERAQLPAHVHPHLLRHTFATLALNHGMDITVIQELLGHAHLSTTQIYAKVSPDTVRQMYDRIV